MGYLVAFIAIGVVIGLMEALAVTLLLRWDHKREEEVVEEIARRYEND